jgi:hypothetical protein
MTRNHLYLLKNIHLNSESSGNGRSIGGGGYIPTLQLAAVQLLIALETSLMVLEIEMHQQTLLEMISTC